MFFGRRQHFGLLVVATWLSTWLLVVAAMPAQVGGVDVLVEANERNQTALKTGVCGDGIVDLDVGEECDCGDRAECKFGRDTCCDYKTCKFVREAVCDSTDPLQTCCDSCQLSPANTVCRKSKSAVCDPIEETCSGTSATCPDDETLPNETPCGEGLHCASGYCTSRSSFCRLEVPKLLINNKAAVAEPLSYNKHSIEITGLCEYRESSEEDEECSWIDACGMRYKDGQEVVGECFRPITKSLDPAVYGFPNGTSCSSEKFGPGICVEGACLRWRRMGGEMRYETKEEHIKRLSKRSYPSAVKMDVILGAVLGTLGGIIFVVAVLWVWRSGREMNSDDKASEKTGYTVEEIVEVRPQRESMIVEKTMSGNGTVMTTTEVDPRTDPVREDTLERTRTERSDHNRIKVTAVEADEDEMKRGSST